MVLNGMNRSWIKPWTLMRKDLNMWTFVQSTQERDQQCCFWGNFQAALHGTYSSHGRYQYVFDVLLYRCCVVNRHGFFFFFSPSIFCKIVVCIACKSPSLFHHAESSPFCNWYYLFTFLFLSKQTRHGRNIAFFYFFCLYVLALSVYHASNVWVRVQEEMPCATAAVWQSISTGDQQLCMKLDDQC
jgi:hypothetical protein